MPGGRGVSLHATLCNCDEVAFDKKKKKSKNCELFDVQKYDFHFISTKYVLTYVCAYSGPALWYTSSQVKITLSFCIARLNSTGFITSYLFSLRKPETRLTHSNQHPQLAWGYWRGLPNSLYPPFPRHPLLPTSRQVRHR